MTIKDVQINTYETSSTYHAGLGGSVKVTEVYPWDPLSKVFKKYTHTITYSGGYVSSNYKISVYTKRLSGREFEYIKPTVKVTAVEVFFGANDNVNSKEPLILGFIYDSSSISSESGSKCKSDKCYYTLSELKSKRGSYKQFTNNLTIVDSVKINDLVTVLLEQLGKSSTTGVSTRQNKLVIRLGERPDGGGGSQYPGSGHYPGKITVKKVEFKGPLMGLTGYEGYEHTFSSPGNVSDLYVSYDNNSRFFNTGSSAKITTVTAYYEDVTVSSEKKLVLITFKLNSGSTYEHSYYDFVSELKGIKDAKNWASDVKTIVDSRSGLTRLDHGGSNLKTRLPEETERLRQLLAFQKGGTNNQNVTTLGPDNVGSDNTFKKVTMTPVKEDSDVPNNRSVGPWYVYNSKLFTGHEDGLKIQPELLLSGFYTGNTAKGNSKKYNTITVYYYVMTGDGSDTGDKKALLVEFDQAATGDNIRGGRGSSDGTKIYFKRKNKDGDNWEKADTDISSNGGKVDESVLTSIGTSSGIIESSNLGATVGGAVGGVAGVVGVGAGVGFAIYKNFAAVTGLIGRLF